MQSINIMGSTISAVDMENLLFYIDQSIVNKKSSYICVANVHTTVMGKRDNKFQNITNSAVLAIPDGMPLIWIGKCKGYKRMGRCSGPDLMKEIFRESIAKGYTHYFYGGTEDTLQRLNDILVQNYPGIRIVGMYSPPFRQHSPEEDNAVVNEINGLAPDIVWVGLGAPKQEIWMYEHVKRIKSSILIGVGAAFNFHARTVKRAPVWVQKAGLEWLYRLIQEPGRLWKRYLVTNTLFLFYLVTDAFKALVDQRNSLGKQHSIDG